MLRVFNLYQCHRRAPFARHCRWSARACYVDFTAYFELLSMFTPLIYNGRLLKRRSYSYTAAQLKARSKGCVELEK